MNILTNNYVCIELDEANSMADTEWFLTTENMTHEEYISVFTEIGRLFKEHQVKKWLGNTTNFRMAVTQEIQDWTATTLTPILLEAGLLKMALLVPEELIANLSVQQSVDEMEVANSEIFVTRYFDNKNAAKEWLLSNN